MFASTLNASRLHVLFFCLFYFVCSSLRVNVICHYGLPKLFLTYKSPLFASSNLLPPMYSGVGKQITHLIKILYKIKMNPDCMSENLFSGVEGLSLHCWKLLYLVSQRFFPFFLDTC